MAPKGIRIPAVKTLYEMLPKGAEGGKEFARLVDLLLFHEARRTGKKIGLFSDVAGDYHGLDSFSGDTFRKKAQLATNTNSILHLLATHIASPLLSH